MEKSEVGKKAPGMYEMETDTITSAQVDALSTSLKDRDFVEKRFMLGTL